MKMNKKMNKTKKKEQNNEILRSPFYILPTCYVLIGYMKSGNDFMPITIINATSVIMKPIMKTLENQPNETCEVQAHFTSVKS